MKRYVAFTKGISGTTAYLQDVDIILRVFIFGLMSPLLAKILPEILRYGSSGMIITIPEATAVDAYAQFLRI